MDWIHSSQIFICLVLWMHRKLLISKHSKENQFGQNKLHKIMSIIQNQQRQAQTYRLCRRIGWHGIKDEPPILILLYVLAQPCQNINHCIHDSVKKNSALRAQIDTTYFRLYRTQKHTCGIHLYKEDIDTWTHASHEFLLLLVCYTCKR